MKPLLMLLVLLSAGSAVPQEKHDIQEAIFRELAHVDSKKTLCLSDGFGKLGMLNDVDPQVLLRFKDPRFKNASECTEGTGPIFLVITRMDYKGQNTVIAGTTIYQTLRNAVSGFLKLEKINNVWVVTSRDPSIKKLIPG